MTGRARIRFGVISHAVAEAGEAKAIDDAIRMAVAAEEAGFESFWLAQHHFGSNRGAVASPFVVMGAIAAATQRIRLGTAIVTAPLENPIRLAEDAATLDTLSRGRLELGIGPGSDPRASEAFGVPHDRRHRDLRRTLESLIAELRGERLIPAAPTLRERLWLSTGSPSGYALAAELGLGILSGRKGSPCHQEDQRTATLLSRFVTGNDRARVGLSRAFFCAPSTQAARAALESPLAAWLATSSSRERFGADYSPRDYLDDRHILIGSRCEIAHALADDPCTQWASDVLLNIPQAAPDAALNLGSIGRFWLDPDRAADDR